MKVLTSLNKCQWKRKENLWCCRSFIGLKLFYYFSALDDENQCESKTRSERFVFVQMGPVSCVWFYFCLNVLCNWVGRHFWPVPATLGGIWSFSSHLCSREASDPAALLVCTGIWLNWSCWYWFGTVRCPWAGTDSLCEPQVTAAARLRSSQLCARSKNFLSWKAVTFGGSLSIPLASVSDCILMLLSCHLVT